MVQYCLHCFLSMALEMGMQLFILCGKEQDQVGYLKIDCFGAYDVSVQNLN